MRTFGLITLLIICIGCSQDVEVRAPKPIPIQEAVKQIARYENRIKVQDGKDVQFEGSVYVVYRSGDIIVSNPAKANSELGLLKYHNEMLVLETTDPQTKDVAIRLIPISNIHHIRFIGKYVPIQEENNEK